MNQNTAPDMTPEALTKGRNPHIVMLGPYIGAFLGMLSETSMNIALPDLVDAFGVSMGAVQWMVVGYMLAIGIVLPCVGFLLKWFKARSLALFALACFLVGAVLSAAAVNFPMLLTGRIIQGVCTGIMLPLMYAAIMRVFPIERIGAANGVAGLVIMFAPVIGPTLSGVLIGALSWRAVFWMFAIVSVVALIVTAATFVNPIETTRPHIDALSVVASAIGFGGLVAGVSLVADQGFSPLVIALLVVGVLVIAFYAWRQLHIATPILDLRALGVAAFRTPALMVTLSFCCTLAFMYLVPQELQRGLGLDSTTAGLLMLPAGIVNAVCSLLAGRMFDKHGAKVLVWFGAVVALVGAGLFMLVGVDSPVWLFIAAHVVFMIGVPFMQQPAQSAALSGVPPRLASDGSAILNTMQQVVGAIGTAVATCLLGLGGSSQAGFVTGSRYGYVFGIVLVVLVLALSFLLKSHRQVRMEQVGD